jgi:hypothetical protein
MKTVWSPKKRAGPRAAGRGKALTEDNNERRMKMQITVSELEKKIIKTFRRRDTGGSPTSLALTCCLVDGDSLYVCDGKRAARIRLGDRQAAAGVYMPFFDGPTKNVIDLVPVASIAVDFPDVHKVLPDLKSIPDIGKILIESGAESKTSAVIKIFRMINKAVNISFLGPISGKDNWFRVFTSSNGAVLLNIGEIDIAIMPFHNPDLDEQ